MGFLAHRLDWNHSADREEGKTPKESIYQVCLLRFRPIMMTTMAALLGALPLAIQEGTGSELRKLLGIIIVGGLLVSQILTLYTTPVIYLYMDKLGEVPESTTRETHREVGRARTSAMNLSLV